MLPLTTVALAGRRRTSDRAVVVLPQPDSPAMPSASAVVQREADPVDRLDRPGFKAEMGPQVLDHEQRRVGVRLPGRGHWRRPTEADDSVIGAARLRIEDVVERVPDEGEGQDHQDDADRGRRDVPPRPEARRAGRLGGVEDLAPRRLEGIAQADEREGRLGEDRPGEGEDRVGHDQVDHVGEDVAAHDVAGSAADDPGPVDEHPLADGQGLRPDDPGRRRPRGHPDDDDDDQQRRPDAERAPPRRRSRRG